MKGSTYLMDSPSYWVRFFGLNEPSAFLSKDKWAYSISLALWYVPIAIAGLAALS